MGPVADRELPDDNPWFESQQVFGRIVRVIESARWVTPPNGGPIKIASAS